MRIFGRRKTLTLVEAQQKIEDIEAYHKREIAEAQRVARIEALSPEDQFNEALAAAGIPYTASALIGKACLAIYDYGHRVVHATIVAGVEVSLDRPTIVLAAGIRQGTIRVVFHDKNGWYCDYYDNSRSGNFYKRLPINLQFPK